MLADLAQQCRGRRAHVHTLHARLDNVQRVHDEGRYGAGAEAGDGLDDCGMEARMARVGHIRPSLLSSCCNYVEENPSLSSW